MNAIPARKNSLPPTRPGGASFSAKPVSEIALGVSRDSISRSRISAWVAAPFRRVRGRPEPSGRRRDGSVCSGTPAGTLGGGVAEGPSVGAGPGEQLLGQERRDAGGHAAEEHVGEVVVAGRNDDERDPHRVHGPCRLRGPTSYEP